MKKYTNTVIKGKKMSNRLPDGYSLVLEGGGTRGYFSSGVFEAFMEDGIMFPYVIGVSAGAANSLSYVSGQMGRGRQMIEYHVPTPEYLSFKNMITKKSYFGYEYVFKTIPEKHSFWDKEMFKSHNVKYLAGAVDCNTGETIWFDNDDILESTDSVIASCSVPFISKVVNYKGYELLDGGITSPIPIDKSIEDGNEFHVIVLTRNDGYRKKAFKYKKLLNAYYKKYPEFIKAMLTRHEIYNRQIELCEQLEKEGKAIIIRPKNKLKVKRTTNDSKKLMELHNEGYDIGKEAIKVLRNELKI
jgi:Predicted esterase of the alpha-beta hydrolase superfamily